MQPVVQPIATQVAPIQPIVVQPTRENSDIIGNRVILCGAHGKNLQAHGSGSVDMSENKAEWEQWTIEDAGNGKVILCGAHGKNLQAHGSGSVDMSENKLDWEQWTVEIA
jgi:hypothetical protein